uniref:F-box domain-containing protein n=1 Tax=Macrostomum lignano TaxID=282301 RepID=A0A1I8JK62_9PLAT
LDDDEKCHSNKRYKKANTLDTAENRARIAIWPRRRRSSRLVMPNRRARWKTADESRTARISNDRRTMPPTPTGSHGETGCVIAEGCRLGRIRAPVGNQAAHVFAVVAQNVVVSAAATTNIRHALVHQVRIDRTVAYVHALQGNWKTQAEFRGAFNASNRILRGTDQRSAQDFAVLRVPIVHAKSNSRIPIRHKQAPIGCVQAGFRVLRQSRSMAKSSYSKDYRRCCHRHGFEYKTRPAVCSGGISNTKLALLAADRVTSSRITCRVQATQFGLPSTIPGLQLRSTKPIRSLWITWSPAVEFLIGWVVAHILGFLGLPDRKSASLVCRNWLQAARHPALMRDVVVDAGSCLSGAAAASSSGSILPPEWKPLVRSLALGSHTSSSKSSFALSWRQLADTLDGCHRLVSVDLSGCDGLCLARDLLSDESQRRHLRDQLVGVRHLSLAGLTRLTATGLKRFVDLFTNLKSLNLRSCSLVCSSSVAIGSMADASVLTFAAVLDVVRRCGIEELDLSCTDVTDSALEQLAKVDSLHLRGIALDSCRLLEGRGLARLIASQRGSLRRLSLAKNRHLQTVGSQPATADQLTELLAPGCSNFINDRLLIASSSSLTVLDISDCGRVSEGALTTALTAARQLRSLAVARCSAFTDAAVTESLTSSDEASLRMLEHLDASSCAGFTDVGLRLLCGHLGKSLRSLRLAWLRGVTDWGLLGLPQPKSKDGEQCEPKYNPPSYNELKSLLSRSVDNSEAAIGPNYSLLSLRRLRLLDLSNCSKVSGIGLDEIFPSSQFPFPDLEELHLQGNRHVQDSHLFNLALGAPSLRQLHLSGSVGVSDKGLVAIVSRCHRLRSLGLANCDGITDAGLQHLAADSLHYVDLSFCSRVSQAGLDQLARRAPRIAEMRGLWTGTELTGN